MEPAAGGWRGGATPAADAHSPRGASSWSTLHLPPGTAPPRSAAGPGAAPSSLSASSARRSSAINDGKGGSHPYSPHSASAAALSPALTAASMRTLRVTALGVTPARPILTRYARPAASAAAALAVAVAAASWDARKYSEEADPHRHPCRGNLPHERPRGVHRLHPPVLRRYSPAGTAPPPRPDSRGHPRHRLYPPRRDVAVHERRRSGATATIVGRRTNRSCVCMMVKARRARCQSSAAAAATTTACIWA